MIEESWMEVRNSKDNLACYEELKSATWCRGLSTHVVMLEYTDDSTFFEYPVEHCMALGLHEQIMKQMRECLGADQFNHACRRDGKRCTLILRPSIFKRSVKRMLPDSSLKLLSGYKVEEHQHSMESYHVLVFHLNFTHGPERNLFRCPIYKINKVYHLYWRFLSCVMFLFRGADRTCATSSDSKEKAESMNRLILEHR